MRISLLTPDFTFQDPALLRPGRFDRILYVGPPDQSAREEILKIRMRKMSVGNDVDVKEIAVMVSDVTVCKSSQPDSRKDRRMLWSRNHCSVSRSSHADHAK